MQHHAAAPLCFNETMVAYRCLEKHHTAAMASTRQLVLATGPCLMATLGAGLYAELIGMTARELCTVYTAITTC